MKNVQKSSKNPPKIFQKSSKIHSKSIKIGSWGHLGPKRPHLSPKINLDLKTAVRRPFVGTLFGSFWTSSWDQKSQKFLKKRSLKVSQKNINFNIDFRSICRRFLNQVGLQNRRKIDHKSIQKSIKNLIDF